MTEVKLIENSEAWELKLKEMSVTQCKISYDFTIESWISEDSFISISIGGKFTLLTDDNEYELDAEGEPTQICPALDVLHQQIHSLVAYKTGLLEIEFTNGMKIKVSVDPNYESWTLNGAHGLLIVSNPGGGLAVWKPK